MYISKIVLDNIRCFGEGFTLDLEKDGKPILWMTFLGDNTTGKTTLLRSIAIGLCDESSAAGLLRESETGYIRRGAKHGTIEITLCGNDGKKKGKITTIIDRVQCKEYSFEQLRQKVVPKDFKPWGDIFVCAYGLGRGSAGTGDITGYTAINAVYNLFNYSEGLQNPELVLRRLDAKNKRYQVIRLLKDLLNLKRTDEIILKRDGIVVDGQWGREMPLRDLADGYRATFQWMTDFFGWVISHNPKIARINDVKGIVLIDAMEEHLHPKWQRVIVKQLSDLLPNIQFIAATHSPLIAAGTADLVSSEIIRLRLEDRKGVSGNIIPSDSIKGMRADQVLTSEAFGLPTSRAGQTGDDYTRFRDLYLKDRLDQKEKEELRRLRRVLKDAIAESGETESDLEVQKRLRSVLKDLQKVLPLRAKKR